MPSNEINDGQRKSETLPESAATSSSQQQPDQKRSFVFDFLYHDARRVGSFLSQFGAYGLVQQVKATEAAAESQSTKTTLSGGMDVPLVAKAGAGFDVTTSTDERDTAERTFDPLWTHARTLLDYLTEHNLIQHDIWNARLGQIILLKGSLVVLDATMLKGAWQRPVIRRLIESGAKTAAKVGQPSASKDEIALLLEMLTLVPHSVQGVIIGTNFNAWCSLSDAALVTTPSDLVLKHGAFIPGEWQVLGVLDAFLNMDPLPNPDGTPARNIDELVQQHVQTPVATALAAFAPAIRNLIGRPNNFFGITPLIIFREVSAEPAGPTGILAQSTKI
jgi:hypothetical protein